MKLKLDSWPGYLLAGLLWTAFLFAFAWYEVREHPGGSGQTPSTAGPHRMPEWMMTEGDVHDLLHEMETIAQLLKDHKEIQRTVEDIPGGIRAVTTSPESRLVPVIRRHARDMRERFLNGTAVRGKDPVYRELFEHRDRIEMKIEDVPRGVRVTETSNDPRLQALIRRRAQRETEFVRHGPEGAHEHTELPVGASPGP